MGQRTTYCNISLMLLFIGGYLCAHDSTVKTVEEQLNGKISHISNLTINIECNPRQVIKDIKQDLFLLFYKIPDIPIRQYSRDLAKSIYDLKYHIGGGIAVAIYLLLIYEVLKGNSCFSSRDSWAMWKYEIPLDELLAMPAHVLSHDLLLEIQRRYTSVDAPADFVSSLVAFMKDIDKEVAEVKYYSNLVIWLKKLRISILFPIRHKLFAMAPERLSRLSYVRNVFLTWAAQYKMDQNKRCCI